MKRIATEFSPETFLTCGEEGDVRQVDLRLKVSINCNPCSALVMVLTLLIAYQHECDSSGSSRCPTPLVSFPFSLYSISVSKLSPWLFVAAGTSPYAYLQDRRMIPSLLKKDWGMRLDENDEGMVTKCVRRFGIPEDGFGDEEEEDEESEEDDREKDGDEERLKKRKRREARAKARFRNSHVTAAKLSSNVDEEVSTERPFTVHQKVKKKLIANVLSSTIVSSSFPTQVTRFIDSNSLILREKTIVNSTSRLELRIVKSNPILMESFLRIQTQLD